jgi:hypothetical protein
MINKSTQVLDLYTTGAWRSLKGLGATINNKDYTHLSSSQALLLRGICESPLEANYSPELTKSLRQENPIAALGLLISRASIAHAIAKLVMDDIHSANEYIQSALATLLSTFDLVGLQTCDKTRERVLSRSAHLGNSLHSQVELKQTLLQKKLPRHLTFVLGMHRSGTSALTGMLVHAGFSAPKGLMPATSRNPKGYWESTRAMRENEALLKSLSSHWSTTAKLPAHWTYTEQARLWRKLLLNCFIEDFVDSHHPIIKDPRLCILIEGLKPWLESDLIDPSFIIAIRDPCEVAKSLKKAENIGISRGLYLWIEYNLKAIRETFEYERRIVDYSLLLENPSIALNFCYELLTPNPNSYTTTSDPTDFIEPGLRNENPISFNNERDPIDGEDFEELHGLAQEIHKIIIRESRNPKLLAKSLRQLERKFVAASI